MKITGHLLGVKDPKAERLLIWGLGPDAKVQLFSSLGQRWVADQPDRTELQAIVKEAGDLREKRNFLAHGVWGYRTERRKELKLFYLGGSKKKIMPSALPIDAKILKTWAADLDALNVRIMKFHKKLGAPLP